MAIRSPQNRAVSYDDVFERFHGNQRTLCQRPLLGVIAHDGPYRWTRVSLRFMNIDSNYCSH